jgi:hypothetical protein
MIDILDQGKRQEYIKEILLSDENITRKNESFRRFEIYKGRIEPYLLRILADDLDPDTVHNMRTISSVNFCKRIVDDKASVYKTPPKRMFMQGDQVLDGRIAEQLHMMYSFGNMNQKLKKSNSFYELMGQCFLQVLPKSGKLKFRVLAPHNLDVIPSADDAEEADVYILSTFDKRLAYERNQADQRGRNTASGLSVNISDGINQKIADMDDYLEHSRFVWWSKDYHFTTNGKGVLISSDVEPRVDNTLGKLPFIDISRDKEMEFWIRYANSASDFTMQMAVMMSDTVEINRLQGFAQPIISSMEQPKNLKIGPNKILWLKKVKEMEASLQPTFQFATPNPNLNASLDMIKMFASLYLSSEGQSPKLISASGEGETFTSGIDRMLAQMQKFEASLDSYDLFYSVERQAFDLIRDWSRVLNGSDMLDPKFRLVVPEDVWLDVNFQKPSIIESDDAKIDRIIKAMNGGLMSRRMGLKELYDIESDDDLDILEQEIDGREPQDI